VHTFVNGQAIVRDGNLVESALTDRPGHLVSPAPRWISVTARRAVDSIPTSTALDSGEFGRLLNPVSRLG